jgi:serine/threonine protein kinase
MDSKRWKLIEDLYHAASELPLDERSAFLSESINGDDELLDSVSSLLAHDSATTSLGVPAPTDWVKTLDMGLYHLKSGTELGRYRVENAIGIGGTSEVYRAFDRLLNRPVAIKILRNHLDAISKERFQREARSASALNHPNICAVYDMGESGNQPYLVMEYLDGCTVQESLRTQAFSVERVLELAIQIADALNAAHSRGIVHREIKPANIFLTQSGHAKVLDFGIAKILEPANERDGLGSSTLPMLLTETGAAIGTVAYMSPEQARGENMDARSDLFSFGVLLYEMTTGTPPFRGITAATLFDAILNREPVSVRSLRPDVPQELEIIIASLLAKNREDRTQEAAAVRSSLQALLEQMTSGVDSPKPAHSRAKHVASRTKVFWSIGLVLATLVGIGLYIEFRNTYRGTRSLVVLPFANESSDAAEEYFTEGIRDAIAAKLAKLHGLQVTKGDRKASRETASQPSFFASVLHVGGEVRVSTKFANPESKIPITKVYEYPVKGILALENEIGRDLATELKIPLSDAEKVELSEAKLVSPAAYERYLRGRQFWNRQTIPDLKNAAEEFRLSTEEGPSYAPAYAGLADSYSMLAWFGGVRPSDILEASRAAAKKAIDIDPMLAEGRVSAGIIAGCWFDLGGDITGIRQRNTTPSGCCPGRRRARRRLGSFT